MNRPTSVVYEEIVPVLVRQRKLVVIKPRADSDRETVCYWKDIPTIERRRRITTITTWALSPKSAEDELEEELRDNRRLFEMEDRLVVSQQAKLELRHALVAANQTARRKYAAARPKMAS
jgi:hypothetical protein